MDSILPVESPSRFDRIKYGVAFGALTAAICAAVDATAAAVWGNRVPFILPPMVFAVFTAGGAVFGGLIGACHGWPAAFGKNATSNTRVRAEIRSAVSLAFIVLFAAAFIQRVRMGHQEYTARESGLLPILAGVAAGLIWVRVRRSQVDGDELRDAALWRVACAAAACALWDPFTRTYQAPMFSVTSLLANAGFCVGLALVYFLARVPAGWLTSVRGLQCARRCLRSAAVVCALGIAESCAIIAARTAGPVDLAIAEHAEPSTLLVNHQSGANRDPNVILIVMDTVRADHLSAYGYPRDTSPNLVEFARQAVRYDRAVATSSWTLPTHASLFTGLMPSEHGADNILTDDGWTIHPLADEYTTLAETLSDMGYATGAVVANTACLSREFGVQQGFDYYDDHARPTAAAAKPRTISPVLWLCRLYQNRVEEWRTGWSRCADEINDDVSVWLDRAEDRPFFLFINYLDAHVPYHSHPEYATRLGATGDAINHIPDKYADDVRRYDEEIAYLDAKIAELFGDLRRRGMFDQSIVVVTSDHGEAFGEHDNTGHGKTLYQEEVHVPLLVRYPGGGTPSVRTDPISLAVVPALITERLGFPFPSEARFAGVSERANIMSELKRTDSPAATPCNVPVLRALYDTLGFKALVSSDGGRELFDLLTDPHERDNLSDRRTDLMDQAAAQVEGWQLRLSDVLRERHAQMQLSPELRERLRSLGYIR